MNTSEFEVTHSVGLAAPFPLAVVQPRTFKEWDLDWPSQARLTAGERQCSAWLYTTDQFPQPKVIKKQQRVWLSPRARRLLHVEDGDLIQLSCPDALNLKILSGLIDDLPDPDEVHVADETALQLAGEDGYALLVRGGWCAPVRVTARELDPSVVRMSMLGRTLISAIQSGRGSPVYVRAVPLWAAPSVAVRDAESGLSQSQQALSRVRGLARTFRRRPARWMERGLALVLGAPVIAMRTSEGSVADDDKQICRLPEDAFALLGISNGDQVIIQWAGRQTVTRALANTYEDNASADHLIKLQRTERIAGDPGSFPQPAADLTAGLAAVIRADLGIPRRTVVLVRRRLLPKVVERANELTVPLGGLAIAALAIRDFDLVWIVLGVLITLVLSFSPLRHERPPRGRWK